MIYDTLTVLLLSALAGEEQDSTNTQVARHLLTHAGELADLSVKALAQQAHVGTGTISRFARDMGFSSFAELKEAVAEFSHRFCVVDGEDSFGRAHALALRAERSIRQVEASIDHAALARLASDLAAYDKVSVFGLLKGQSAALSLQADLLMQGKYADTALSLPEQAKRMTAAGKDQLFVIFSYTAAYFDYHDFSKLLRIDRPKIWMVCGERRALPGYVADRLLFDSDHDLLGHPYQLVYAAGLIAQEYARRAAANQKE